MRLENILVEALVNGFRFRSKSLDPNFQEKEYVLPLPLDLPAWLIEMPNGITPVSHGLAAVRTELRRHLAPFEDQNTGHIGFKLHSFHPAPTPPTIDTLAERVLLAAAVHGARPVAVLVANWVSGAPVTCEEVLRLEGIRLPKRYEFQPGVRLDTILGDEAKDLTIRDHRMPIEALHALPTELTGPALVFDRFLAAPVFFKPDNQDHEREDLQGPCMDNHEIGELVDSLSLSCNNNVGVSHSWTRFSKLLRVVNSMGGRSHMTYLGNTSRSQVELTPEMLRSARDILGQRTGRRDLDVPIRRWKNSKSARNAEDRLIDLRVVLEALYAGGAAAELTGSIRDRSIVSLDFVRSGGSVRRLHDAGV